MVRRTKVVFFVLLFLSGFVFSQTGRTGSINGTVRTAEGDPLSGVIVLLKSPALVIPEIEMITSDAGMFRFPSLSPGVYEITCIRDGLEKMVCRGIVVKAGKTAKVDIGLTQRAGDESTGQFPRKYRRIFEAQETFVGPRGKYLSGSISFPRKDLSLNFHEGEAIFAEPLGSYLCGLATSLDAQAEKLFEIGRFSLKAFRDAVSIFNVYSVCVVRNISQREPFYFLGSVDIRLPRNFQLGARIEF
jgi:hypothetical protein